MTFVFKEQRAPMGTNLIPALDLALIAVLLAAFVIGGALDPLRTGLPVTTEQAAYSGPPRLVTVTPGGLALNGEAMDPRSVLLGLVALTESGSDLVVLAPRNGTDTGRIMEVIELLTAAGFTSLALVDDAP